MFSPILKFSLLLSASFVFVGCSESSSSSTYNPDIGPFDENGNYVEAWADNPPKRGSELRKTEPQPQPQPIAKATPPPEPIPRRIAPAPAPVPIPAPAPVPVITPRPVTYTQPVVTTPVVAPQPVATAPSTIRHVVKRGDTLFGLSRRYGKSISAIKSANGISGSTIITGRSYIIPQ